MYTIIISWLTSHLVDKIKPNALDRSASQALWYHGVKNKVLTSQYSHIHHRLMVDEFPVNFNTGATNLYWHIFQTVTLAYKMTLACNDDKYMIHVWLHLLEVLMCFFVGLRSNVHTVWPVWYSILTHWWNDPPVRLLYSIFDLGYYVILISDIGNGNGTIEQHPLPLPPPPRLLHDSATIWRICFICATNITHEWTVCHVPLSG